MGCLCFGAASSNEPEEEEVDINAISWDFTAWLRFWKDGKGRSIGETSSARGSGASPTAGDDGNKSSAIEKIPTVETEIVPRISEDDHIPTVETEIVPRISEDEQIRTEIVPRIISEEQWSLYKSLSDKKSRMKGVLFYIDSAYLMREYLCQLSEPKKPDDPQISNRNAPMLYPARSMERAPYGELPKHMEDIVRSIALDYKDSVEAVLKMATDLKGYMRVFLQSRYGNAAPDRIILPLNTATHGRVSIWINPSLTSLLEKEFGYHLMPPYSNTFKMVLGPRVCVVDECEKWMENAINFFTRMRCKVLPLKHYRQAIDIMRLGDVTDDVKLPPHVFKLDMIVAEYHHIPPNDPMLAGGICLLRRMKESKRWENTPFIMTSSYDDLSVVKQCLEAGADMVVIKPLLDYEDVEELEYLLRTVLYYKMHKNWSNI